MKGGGTNKGQERQEENERERLMRPTPSSTEWLTQPNTAHTFRWTTRESKTSAEAGAPQTHHEGHVPFASRIILRVVREDALLL